MSDSDSKRQPDPFAVWRPLQEAWAKAANEAVGSEELAQAMGQAVESYLDSAAPLRAHLEKALGRGLGDLNLPSRAELAMVAERLTNVELRLDDVDAKLDRALDHLEAIRGASESPGRAAAGSGSGEGEKGRATGKRGPAIRRGSTRKAAREPE